ncbi:MAG: phosphotransferase [Candidatus Levybacteria bacterium]|nr:phosphotransferase [Candidatus Levybacteria bacterium]
MAANRELENLSRFSKDWRPESIHVEKAGGQTNRNFIVTSDQGKVFVRIPWERSDIVNRDIEARNILALSRNEKTSSIIPKYQIYVLGRRNILDPESQEFDLPDGAMVTSYIEGEQLDGDVLRDKNVQNALTESLHTFHTSGVKFENEYDVFRDEVDKYRSVAEKYDIEQLFSKETSEQIKIIEGQAMEMLPVGGEISTHNDLIVENLILGKDGKVYILDFEYSGRNTRSGLQYDIGTLLGGNMFHNKPVTFDTFEGILESARHVYKEPLNREQIFYGALTNIIVMFWWGTVRYFSVESPNEKTYFRKYVLDRAQGIQDLDAHLRRGRSPPER